MEGIGLLLPYKKCLPRNAIPWIMFNLFFNGFRYIILHPTGYATAKFLGKQNKKLSKQQTQNERWETLCLPHLNQSSPNCFSWACLEVKKKFGTYAHYVYLFIKCIHLVLSLANISKARNILTVSFVGKDSRYKHIFQIMFLTISFLVFGYLITSD